MNKKNRYDWFFRKSYQRNHEKSQLKSEQSINRNTRRLQTNQKDFKQNNSSHMTFIYICSTQSWNLNNRGIFSTNYIIIVKKYFMRPNKIYIYLESARRDLQNGVKILVS